MTYINHNELIKPIHQSLTGPYLPHWTYREVGTEEWDLRLECADANGVIKYLHNRLYDDGDNEITVEIGMFTYSEISYEYEFTLALPPVTLHCAANYRRNALLDAADNDFKGR